MRQKGRGGHPTLQEEIALGFPDRVVAGIDESGVGSIAGPLVVAIAVLPPVVDYEQCPWLRMVKDSKKLSAAKRELVYQHLVGWLPSYSVGVASAEEIDSVGIRVSHILAAIRAGDQMQSGGWGHRIQHVLLDGKIPYARLIFDEPVTVSTIVGGDMKCLSIACASILAKVTVDRMMDEYDALYPGYGFSDNKGYPTDSHLSCLHKLGPTVIHRTTYSLVKSLPSRL